MTWWGGDNIWYDTIGRESQLQAGGGHTHSTAWTIDVVYCENRRERDRDRERDRQRDRETGRQREGSHGRIHASG